MMMKLHMILILINYNKNHMNIKISNNYLNNIIIKYKYEKKNRIFPII